MKSNLTDIILRIMNEYPIARMEKFKGHEFAKYMLNIVPRLIANEVNFPEEYSIQCSPGRGNWAWIPWIAILNEAVTKSVRKGIFIVYLFKADLSGVYLSLGQGVTVEKKNHGLRNTRDLLRKQASLIRDSINNKKPSHINIQENIDLNLDFIPRDPSQGKRI